MAAAPNPVILSALDLEVHYGEQKVLDKTSLSIHEKDRIGLVGRNGAGKSTFLKIVAGLLPPDSGEIARRKDLVVGFLSQEFTLIEPANVYANIASGAQRELDLIKEYEDSPFDSPKRHILEATILRLDSWNLEKRIEMLIGALNAPTRNRIVSELSGGEKKGRAMPRTYLKTRPAYS